MATGAKLGPDIRANTHIERGPGRPIDSRDRKRGFRGHLAIPRPGRVGAGNLRAALRRGWIKGWHGIPAERGDGPHQERPSVAPWSTPGFVGLWDWSFRMARSSEFRKAIRAVAASAGAAARLLRCACRPGAKSNHQKNRLTLTLRQARDPPRGQGKGRRQCLGSANSHGLHGFRAACCATTTASACCSPQRIDPETGYRFYLAGQLERLNRILALKDLGLSLDQVARMLDDKITAGEIRGMLALKKAELERTWRGGRAASSHRIPPDARSRKQGTLADYDVVIKSVEATPFLSVRQTFPAWGLRSQAWQCGSHRDGARAERQPRTWSWSSPIGLR